MGTDQQSRAYVGQLFSGDGDRTVAFKRLAGLLGGKWHLAILYHLSESGETRFSRLQAEIDGISAKMLSESLDRLETRYGVVQREIVSDQPLHVEYSLTAAGESIEPVLSATVEWARTHQSLIDEWDDGVE
jgi:DNA-binding HxlR family transcriptional regulator